jgi:hypothetical protein
MNFGSIGKAIGRYSNIVSVRKDRNDERMREKT